MADVPDGSDDHLEAESESEETWSPFGGELDEGAGGGRVLDLDDGVAEGPPSECAIDGCSRDGVAARKLKRPGTDEEPIDHYVCRYHYRLFLGVRVLLLLVVLALFGLAFFRI